MSAQQLNVEVISNNIANMNTVGFKRQRAEFQDLMYQNVERVGARTSDSGTVAPTGIQIGAGVKAGSTYRITEQGSMTKTENRYDLGIDGKGFFRVLLPSGETGYTRAGNFGVDDQGRLVTDDGYVVQPEMNIPEGVRDVVVSKSGQVQAFMGEDPQPQDIGQLQLATFVNEAGLEAIGDNLLLESGASGAPVLGNPGEVGFGQLMQGYTEASNVDAVSEITALIVAQRAYEMNSKVINTADEMLSAANQLKQ
jgi:flagellar basal-body rod protein FlgG